jgi:hypothetical protein
MLVSYEKITFSADENLISRARLSARAQHKTLNAAFSEWLVRFAGSSGNAQGFDALMKRLKHVDAGKHFRREELNERKSFQIENLFLSPAIPTQPILARRFVGISLK